MQPDNSIQITVDKLQELMKYPCKQYNSLNSLLSLWAIVLSFETDLLYETQKTQVSTQSLRLSTTNAYHHKARLNLQQQRKKCLLFPIEVKCHPKYHLHCKYNGRHPHSTFGLISMEVSMSKVKYYILSHRM